VAAGAGDVPGSRDRRWGAGSEQSQALSRRAVLYVIRKYLHISPDEWDAYSWDIQRTYLEGLTADEDVPFRVEEGPDELAAANMGPTIRTNVDAGTDVIDLAKMKAELEALRDEQLRQQATA
jgi:hypothetical protein